MRAFNAHNMRFAPHKAFSREGTTVRATVAGAVTAMYNWITSGFNRVLFSEGTTKIRSLNVPDSAISDLFTGLSNVRGITVAESGMRAYVATFNTQALGAGAGLVTDGGSGNDQILAPPLQFTASSAVDGGTGLCTAGTHLIGFVFQSRSGFSGKPSPVNGSGVFTPLSVTLNAGRRTINVSITLNTPATAGLGSAIYVIMTRADNPNKWFFVPGVFAVLPPSAAGWTQPFQISVTDEDLANRAELADDQFNVLSQTIGGVPPFYPSVTLAYRRRIVWIADNKAYISEIDDGQSLSEDQHVIQTPGQKRIVTAFPLGASLWLVGDKWVAETSDNGDIPRSWSQPKEISGMGTTAPLGVDWRTAGQYAWMACEDGLRLFRGVFDPIPITYLFAGWQSINWAAAYAIQVVDDIVNRRCYIACPMGNFTEPSHLITVDYTQGLAYDAVDISLDNFSFGFFSSICAVKEAQSARTVMWIGPAAAGPILFLDKNTHNDNGQPIHAVWESGYLRNAANENDIDSHYIRVGNAAIGVTGSGTLTHTWFGTDRVKQVAPMAIPMVLTPGTDVFSKFDLPAVEDFSVRLETNSVDTWFELTSITTFCKRSLYNP